MSVIEARLKELGVTLPTPPVPVASYVPCTITGNLVFVSGQIPIADGATLRHQRAGAIESRHR